MKTITLKLHSFGELERDSKGRALTTYRDLNVDFDWWDFQYDDFIGLCSCIGISVIRDKIKFSGFYCQGDGSGFTAKVDIAGLLTAIKNQSWKVYAPKLEFPFPVPDIDRRILPLLEKGVLPNDSQIICCQRYYGVTVDLGSYAINENGKVHDNIFEELDKLEAWLSKVAKILNHHLYTTLEQQYEFLVSDTAVEESILANDYLFTADGRSANHLKKLTQTNHN